MKKAVIVLLVLTLLLGITSCQSIFPSQNPDGETPSVDETPSDGQKPDDNKPGEDDNKPGEDDNKPGEDDNKPGEDDNKPGEDDNKPGEGDENAVTVSRISVGGAKTRFKFAEEFNTDGIVITATMSDGTKRALEADEYSITCPDYNSMKVGQYTVTVSVNGTSISLSYDISVAEADKLKVLMIGNSFADDTINYAYEIAKSSGIPAENIIVADIYIGGCVLNTHWANAQSNAAAYRFGLEREGWFDGSSYTNWTMEQAIKYADWDFITFQQGSSASGDPTSFNNLQNLMNYVYDVATDEVNNPNANPNVKFVWH